MEVWGDSSLVPRPHLSAGHLMVMSCMDGKGSDTFPMREFVYVLECWDSVRNVNWQHTARWTVRTVENQKRTALWAVIHEESHRLGYADINSKPVSAMSAIW